MADKQQMLEASDLARRQLSHRLDDSLKAVDHLSSIVQKQELQLKAEAIERDKLQKELDEGSRLLREQTHLWE